MNTFLSYLFVLVLFGLITLPAFVGHARERAIDRQLHRAGQLVEEGPHQLVERQLEVQSRVTRRPLARVGSVGSRAGLRRC
ncbi:hypothetical protein OG735_28430 [Streptomyces sp. NBC_01210]|uniref:hypothetical protein n=1 Tax=Streptomyces sp. NBC_01210 TaxID=2903774 RepID=UPI002E11328E|nr:hypothetical protein OG735_28430 [Streptomyces sp. NBC_01210]